MGAIFTFFLEFLRQFLGTTWGKWLFKISLFGTFYVAMKELVFWSFSYVQSHFLQEQISGIFGYILCQLDFSSLLDIVLSAYLTISLSRWSLKKIAEMG